MIFNRSIFVRALLLIAVMANLTILSSKTQADTGSCGGATTTLPFTDVMASPFFCQIAAAYFSGLTNGTSATTYSPAANVTREQMASFISRTMDQSLKRVDTTTGAVILPTTPLSGTVSHSIFDGTNLWIPCGGPDQVYVVRGVGGPPLLGTVLAQLTGNGLNGPFQAAFDGERICVTNASAQSVSLWKASDLSPLGAVNVTSAAGFNPRGVCSDGTMFLIGIRHQGGGSSSITPF